MFMKRFRIFRLFGFDVYVDFSWIIIALLLFWSFSVGFFPDSYPGMSQAAYWGMGAGAIVGLAVSIVFHEMSHSLVARVFGIPIGGITLFIFGGVAEMTKEPERPRDEAVMAAAGPAASLVLASLLAAAVAIGQSQGVGVGVLGVLGYLAGINGLIFAFNLIPAFPLDGGRILRAGLWRWKKDFRKATQIAANTGAAFGMGLVVLGVVWLFFGDVFGGIWIALIGLFLRGAASMSMRDVLIREALRGEPVARLMNRHPVTVGPSMTLDNMIEEYFFPHKHKVYPVLEEDRVIGYVSIDDVREVPRDMRGQTSVRDVMRPLDEQTTLSESADALEAFQRISKSSTGRLIISDHERLSGIMSRADVWDFVSIKLDLEKAA